MFAAHFDFGENVFAVQHFAIGDNVAYHAADLKQAIILQHRWAFPVPASIGAVYKHTSATTEFTSLLWPCEFGQRDDDFFIDGSPQLEMI